VVRAQAARAFAALERHLAADPEARGYSLHVANSLWGHLDFPFLDSYIGFVDEHFGAPLTLVDFVRDTEGARVRINTWVEERTRDRIRDLIPAGTLTPETLLVLTNAIYFKGNWAEEFDPDSTRDAEFRGLAGTATVPMMTRKGDYGYLENEEAQVIELPYEGGDLSMVVMLPRVEGPAGLEALERALTPANVDAWIGGLRKREIAVSIPRFEMTWGTTELKGALKALGIRRAFDVSADFSGMSDAGPLFVGHVLHKAFVEVNEEGTEAAAATAVVMLKAAMPTVFRADRPFVFMIRDRSTGSILFLGRVTDLGE
jgi:serpin B